MYFIMYWTENWPTLTLQPNLSSLFIRLFLSQYLLTKYCRLYWVISGKSSICWKWSIWWKLLNSNSQGKYSLLQFTEMSWRLGWNFHLIKTYRTDFIKTFERPFPHVQGLNETSTILAEECVELLHLVLAVLSVSWQRTGKFCMRMTNWNDSGALKS